MASVIEQGAHRPRPARSGLRIQFRVIGALILRELHTRYGRENIGYLWLILEPMMLATMIGLLHSRHASHYGSDVKPVPLALIGYCNFMVFRGAVSRSEGILEANSQLFYHRSVAPLDIILARIILEAAGSFMAFVILIGLAIAFGVCSLPERPLVYLLGVFLMTWLSFAIAMIVCGFTHERRAVGRLVHPIVYILLPLSGAFYMMEPIPSPIRNVILYIPMAHCFELLRYGWFHSASPNFIDWGYLGSWLIGGTLVGLLLLSVVRKRIHLS